MNLLGAELSVGNDYGEYDQHGNCVLVVYAVGEVIVIALDAKKEYGHSRDHAKNVHCGGLCVFYSSRCLAVSPLLVYHKTTGLISIGCFFYDVVLPFHKLSSVCVVFSCMCLYQ